MKVLFVGLGYYPAEMGGVVNVNHNWTRFLSGRGHMVHMACTNRLNRRHKLFDGTRHTTLDGVHVHYFDTTTLGWWPGSFGPAFSVSMLVWMLRRIKTFDVVHIHEFRTFPTMVAAVCCWIWSVPYILHPHGSLPTYSRRRYMKLTYDAIIGRRIFRRAAKLIAVQEHEQQVMRDLGAEPGRIRVLANGVDVDSFEKLARGYLRHRLGLGSGKKIALFLGRLHCMKGPDILIRAISDPRLDDVHLVIAGPDDGYEAYCRQLVAELALESRVSFLATLDRQTVPRAIADADVFVLPSRTDACPLALLESAAAGVPIVVSRNCEMASYFDGHAGLSVSPTPELVSDAIVQISNDGQLARALAAGAKQLAREHFSVEATAQVLEQIYAECSGSTGPGAWPIPARSTRGRVALQLKRGVEACFAALALAALSPVLLLIGLAVRITSAGPVFYKAERVGRDGRLFRMWKFRTMVVGADTVGPLVTAGDDRRITPLGRRLRRTKLDELPALINVLRGDMSLVGPRPENPKSAALYTEAQRRVLSVRPGLTSLATLKYFNEEELLSGSHNVEDTYHLIMQDKLELDLHYIDQQSLLLDVSILKSTVQRIFGGRPTHA